MKVYYKGDLVPNSGEKNSTHVVSGFLDMAIAGNNIVKLKNKLNSHDYHILYYRLNDYVNSKTNIRNEEITTVLNKLTYYYDKEISDKFQEIIFEIVEDTDGNLYGKEILSNLLFPLATNPSFEYYYNIDSRHTIERRKTFQNNNIARFAYTLYPTEVASINAVEEYSKQQKNNYIPSAFVENIKWYYNENVFAKEIELKEKEPLEKQDEVTKLMEEIEYTLELVEQFNKDLYYKLLSEYGELIIKENSNNFQHYTALKKEFSQLLSKIKLSLLVKEENNESIIDFLNSIIEAYFNKIFNDDNKDNINLIDIDNFTDMFLKSKNKYPYSIQRQILKKISLIYILFLKLNSDNINLESLENSYFNDNKRTILLNISALSELGIINGISIDFNKEYSNEQILNIIKEMEFNKSKEEDIRKLIK